MGPNKKVYIVHAYSDRLSHIEKIIELNPDVILLWCDVEYEAEHIFKDFLAQISDYIVRHNKPVIILYPGPSHRLTENVLFEKTYGYYLINLLSIINSTSHLDFNNVHLQADKLYTLYTNRGSPERIKIIDTLAREDMLGEGIVTFHGVRTHDQPNWQYHDGSPLKDEADFVIGEHYAPDRFPKSFFRGFVDIVCESRVDNNEFFTTEKTAKSIATLKPFLALSCQHYHRHLRDEYGVLPYSRIFDYSFDKCPDINDRIEGIVQNIQRLKSMNKNDVHARLFDTLVHNKNQFINYGTLREKMVPNALEFILNEPCELLGDTIASTPSWFELISKNGWIQ